MLLFPLNNGILNKIVAKVSFSQLSAFVFCREDRNKISVCFVGFFLRSHTGQHKWVPLRHRAQSPSHWPKGCSETLSQRQHGISAPFCNFHPSQLSSNCLSNSTSLECHSKALPLPQINELCLTCSADEMQGYISSVNCLLSCWVYSRKWIRRRGHFRQKSYCKANSSEEALGIILFFYIN